MNYSKLKCLPQNRLYNTVLVIKKIITFIDSNALFSDFLENNCFISKKIYRIIYNFHEIITQIITAKGHT